MSYEKTNIQTPIVEISNTKHQIANKSQITIFNDQNRIKASNLDHFDFSRIDEKIYFSSLASWIGLLASSFKIIFVFGILNFGHCDLFDIYDL